MLVKVKGKKYLKLLEGIHQRFDFDYYLEIGSRTGDSLVPVRSKTIAVDPQFRIQIDVVHHKPALMLFQQTSDDFFASDVLQRAGIKLDFSFLDGMHQFEFLLRDFMNTEANSSPNGVIAMHDCLPWTLEMTSRDPETQINAFWTGDVWKLLPILRDYRPDLKVTILDSRPTGIVLISGLNPKSKTLKSKYDEIVETYSTVDLEAYGLERFNNEFVAQSSAEYLAAGLPAFAGLKAAELA